MPPKYKLKNVNTKILLNGVEIDRTKHNIPSPWELSFLRKWYALDDSERTVAKRKRLYVTEGHTYTRDHFKNLITKYPRLEDIPDVKTDHPRIKRSFMQLPGELPESESHFSTGDNDQLSNLQLDQSSDRNVSGSSTNVQTSTSNSHSSEPAPKRRREEVDANRMPMISSETDAPSSTNEKSWSFYLNHQFTDYKISTLANDNKRVFDVHRNILASKSGYFERLFLENNDQTSTVIEEDPSIVALMIEFMYRDKLDNVAAYVTKLFKAAIRFEIPTLKALTFKHLEQNSTTDNAGAYVLLAMETSDAQMKELMRSFIRRSPDNHSKIRNSTEFDSLLDDANEFHKAHLFLRDLLNDSQSPK
ncbi:hypothetical protein M3Y94_01077400 [Aphelenchoides besseyi]|nr:hypothetical protein M3Y94_01077400 [Aphelenchoides besseyi]KAI6218759.1 Speckle-type POZ protein A-like protein [Aphelenchoides besseyi]